MDTPRRPVRFESKWFEKFTGDIDPVQRVQLAHETAAALLARVRKDADEEVVQRLLALAETDGIDVVAELWSDAEPHSLPGALWRIHLIKVLVAQQPIETAAEFQTGAERLDTADVAIAGAAMPTGPDEIADLADTILRGVFVGDFGLALSRAAAFCRILAAGAVAHADNNDVVSPERATELTTRAARLATMGKDLAAAAALWRSDELH